LEFSTSAYRAGAYVLGSEPTITEVSLIYGTDAWRFERIIENDAGQKEARRPVRLGDK
jgi:hypothetical protein